MTLKYLYVFLLFVMVWFNSEDNEKLIDKCFPLKFMKTYSNITIIIYLTLIYNLIYN